MGYGAWPAVLRPFPDGAPGVIQRAMLSRRPCLPPPPPRPCFPRASARASVEASWTESSENPQMPPLWKSPNDLASRASRSPGPPRVLYWQTRLPVHPSVHPCCRIQKIRAARDGVGTSTSPHFRLPQKRPAASSAVEGIAITRALRAPTSSCSSSLENAPSKRARRWTPSSAALKGAQPRSRKSRRDPPI